MDDKMKVEIRWSDPTGPTERDPFHIYLRWLDRTETPTAMEEIFRMWLAEKVEGRKMIVSDLEFWVDDRMIELAPDEENEYFRRIGDAAGK
jgi:hypothetical protein